jgi:hypothetical protein
MSGEEDLTADDLAAAMNTLDRLCGLRRDFLLGLLQEASDWSFVIKAHAVLESVVCQLLAAHFQQSTALEYVLANKVQMEHRIEMLKACSLVDETDRKMMRLFGRIRNSLVHNVQQTDFTFSEYLRNPDVRHNFIEAFATKWQPSTTSDPPLSRAEAILQSPRYAVWVSLIDITARALTAKMVAEQRAAMDEVRRERTRGLREATGTKAGDNQSTASSGASDESP